MIGPSFEPHQCLLTGTWRRMTWLLCLLSRGWQVWHQRWIWGHLGYQCHPPKGLISSKYLLKIVTLFRSFPFYLQHHSCTKIQLLLKEISSRNIFYILYYQTTLHSWNSELMIDQSKNCSKNLDIRPCGNFQMVQISSGLAPNFLEYLPNTPMNHVSYLYYNFS